MTAKQLAERLGIDQKELDFVIGEPCSKCKRVGGVNKPCDKEKCVVVAVVEVKEGA